MNACTPEKHTALLLREDETRPQDRPREAAPCARARPQRLPMRGRVVRPREAATARRAGFASRGSLPASCGSPACLLHLQIPSAGTLAVVVQPQASRATELVRERRDGNERIRGILVFFSLFLFSQSFFLGLNVSPTNG